MLHLIFIISSSECPVKGKRFIVNGLLFGVWL